MQKTKSNPLSAWIKPVLEKRKTIPLTIAMTEACVLMMGIIPTSHAFSYELTERGEARIEETVVTTESSYIAPVPEAIGVSQEYHGLHHGLDIRAPKGSPVVAIADGVVVEVGETGWGYGKYVRIAHEGTVASFYAHLDEIKVGRGQRVRKGESIGTIGTTGWVTGAHLHWEMWEGGKTVNPRKYYRE